MNKIGLFVSMASVSTMMWGCLDAATEALPGTQDSATGNPFSGSVTNYEDLQVCVESRNGMKILVSSESRTYRCTDGEWVPLESVNDPEQGVSSSSEQIIYSSSDAPQDSSDVIVCPAMGDCYGYINTGCTAMWCGSSDAEGRVLTGYEDREETSGYWFDYDDNDAPKNGTSKIFYPADVIDDTYFSFFGPLDEAYGGIKATIIISSGYENPYAGFGFNIVSENQEGADISGWNGICLTYSSTAPFDIILQEADEATTTEYQYFKSTVPVSETLTTVNVSWADFQKSYVYGMLYDIDSYLKSVAAVKLQFSESSDFFLTEVGHYGTCSGSGRYVNPDPVIGRIDTSSASGDYVSTEAYWLGSDGTGKVETGSDDETAGWWYDYNDNAAPENGDTKITFPSDVYEDVYGNFYGPLVQAYGGIKATIDIGTAYEYAYAGFAFNVWGEDQQGVDISQWDGVCVAYTSTAGFFVELVPENEMAVTEGNNYKANVIKAPAGGVVTIPWSKFKQETGWGIPVDQNSVLQHTATVRIRFTSSNDFFLSALTSGNRYCGNYAY